MSTLSRRQFVSASAVATAGLTLVACGGGAANNEPAADATTDAAATDAAYTLVEEGKLTCISNLYFPPFESMDEKTGDPVGFDIDMSVALAEHLGLEANWLPSQAFDSLVPTIKAGGTADVAIAGITITDARQQEVYMSDPYVDSNQSIVVKVGSTETADSLDADGKKIAVQAGTTGEEWAIENLPAAAAANGIIPLDDIISAMNGVLTGSYDALVTDLPVASYQIKNSFTDLVVLEEIPTGEQYGIVVSKDNPGLISAINDALAEMEQDGSMAEIQTKWFGSAL